MENKRKSILVGTPDAYLKNDSVFVDFFDFKTRELESEIKKIQSEIFPYSNHLYDYNFNYDKKITLAKNQRSINQINRRRAKNKLGRKTRKRNGRKNNKR